jgi:hypothetical protein
MRSTVYEQLASGDVRRRQPARPDCWQQSTPNLNRWQSNGAVMRRVMLTPCKVGARGALPPHPQVAERDVRPARRVVLNLLA